MINILIILIILFNIEGYKRFSFIAVHEINVLVNYEKKEMYVLKEIGNRIMIVKINCV